MTSQYNTTDERAIELLAERKRREMEALSCYRPMATQLPFHLSKATERLVRGGNRSGKTVCVASEFASAVTGIPITGPDGQPLPYNYPRRPLIAWLIGFDLKHLGQTLHRVLFEPGYFNIIKDEKTGIWRTYNPADPKDKARASESRPADPLIPPRLIDPSGWAWEEKSSKTFTQCTLYNGTKIFAFPSTAPQPKQGDPADIIYIDEDVKYPEHVEEYRMRLLDREGRLTWAAWPHSSNEALRNLHERAVEQKDDPDPVCHEIVLTQSDNPFLTDKAKRSSLDSMDATARRTRDRGEFTFDEILMYDFKPDLHGIPNGRGKDDPLNVIYEAKHEFPREWTRYLVLDPGHAKTGVLFAVVPPPDRYGNVIIIEDELFLRKASCADVAEAVLPKVQGKTYESFIIDYRAGRQHPMGSEQPLAGQYADAFEEKGIRSHQTESGFMWGSDDVTARCMEVRNTMRPRSDGTTGLRVVMNNTYFTRKEFGLYSKVMMNREAQERPAKGNDDLMNCLEYLLSVQPEYIAAVRASATVNPVLAGFRREMQGDGPANASMNFGPPRATL